MATRIAKDNSKKNTTKAKAAVAKKPAATKAKAKVAPVTPQMKAATGTGRAVVATGVKPKAKAKAKVVKVELTKDQIRAQRLATTLGSTLEGLNASMRTINNLYRSAAKGKDVKADLANASWDAMTAAQKVFNATRS